MSAAKSADIIASLKKKGFELDNTHHHRFHYVANGKRTAVRTYISHGIREYGDTLLSAVAGQMKLSKKELMRFIECTLSAEEYQQLLTELGVVTSL